MEKNREVKVVIREMVTGETPKGFIAGSSFEDFNNIAIEASLKDQMELVTNLVESVGKHVASQQDRMASAGFAMLMHKAVIDSLGKEASLDGAKLLKAALDPSPEVICKLAKIVSKALADELEKDGE